MDLTHEFTVPAGVAETWAALNDIAGVAECFPGAQVTSVEGDSFQGTVKVKLGPIALVYNGTGTFAEKDETAGRMVVDAKGKDKRGNGTAGAHVTVTLAEEGGSTTVRVVTDLSITGKPAQFGRGVIQDVSDKLLGQFTTCLETKVGAPDDPAGTAEPVATPDPQAPQHGGGDSGEAERIGNIRRLTADAAGAASAEAPATPATPASAPHVARTSARPSDDDALDLGATVLPVLAKAYWKQAAGALVVLLVLLRLLGRRS